MTKIGYSMTSTLHDNPLLGYCSRYCSYYCCLYSRLPLFSDSARAAEAHRRRWRCTRALPAEAPSNGQGRNPNRREEPSKQGTQNMLPECGSAVPVLCRPKPLQRSGPSPQPAARAGMPAGRVV